MNNVIQLMTEEQEIAQFKSQVKPRGAELSMGIWQHYFAPYYYHLSFVNRYFTTQFVKRMEAYYA